MKNSSAAATVSDEIWAVSLAGNAATSRQSLALARSLAVILGSPDALHFIPSAAFPGIPSAREILSASFAEASPSPPWPGVVIGCRPEVSSLVLGIKQASRGLTAAIQIQDPGPGVDHAEFDLIVRQPHEAIRGANVIASSLAIHGLVPADFRWARQKWEPRLSKLTPPLRGVLIGGGDDGLVITAAMALPLAAALKARADAAGGTTVILSSRRTPAALCDALQDALSGDVRFVWGDGSVDYLGLVSCAEEIVVSADSLSMLSEAMASGADVSVWGWGGTMGSHPMVPLIKGFIANGAVGVLPGPPVSPAGNYRNELPGLAELVARRITRSAPHAAVNVAAVSAFV